MDHAFLLSAKGRGFSFLHFERNKDRALFYERIRKIFFLLGAKGSENGKGLFSESAPCNPKTPHTPTNGKRARGEHSPPYLRGQKGTANKSMNERVTDKRQISCGKQEGGRAFATKADGKKCRPLFMNYNLTSLSRARKF